MRGGTQLRRAIPSVCAAVALAAPATAEPTLLVHLPSAPIEAAERLAGAVNELGAYLSRQVPGLALKVEMFRRREDAELFLQDHREDVVGILSETSFLLSHAQSLGLEPAYRFVRSGRQTYRQIVIVRRDRQDLQALGDLGGKMLGVVDSAGQLLTAFLERVVFEGEVELEGWIRGLERSTDDFSATARVLYGETDAALVSEENPLVRSHLGQELRALYTSPPLSLPVLALRLTSLDSGQRLAIQEAFRTIGQSESAAQAMVALKLDSIAPLTGTDLDRDALVSLPKDEGKRLEIAVPTTSSLAILSPVPASGVRYLVLSIELPEVPPAAELVQPTP